MAALVNSIFHFTWVNNILRIDPSFVFATIGIIATIVFFFVPKVLPTEVHGKYTFFNMHSFSHFSA